MLTPGPHICMTMGLHACQYCTCMHIQSDFDQHNITHSTACTRLCIDMNYSGVGYYPGSDGQPPRLT